jgi:hypothetical protein
MVMPSFSGVDEENREVEGVCEGKVRNFFLREELLEDFFFFEFEEWR